jgi:hypothetical protein
MIEGISAITLGTHEMPRAVQFYRALGFEVLYAAKSLHSLAFEQGRTLSTSSPSLPSGAGPGGGGQSSTLPMLTHFTTARSPRDTGQLPCPTMPNGASASST